MHAPSGRAAFSVLLFQDLAVAPILIAIALFAGRGAAGPAGLFTALAPAVLGLAVIVIAGRLVLRPLFRSAARAKSPELFMAASLLVVIAASLSAATLGLSMALGAFIAGILLAETEFRHEVEVLIEPFKGLLLGLFFLSTGVSLNLPLLAREPADDPRRGGRVRRDQGRRHLRPGPALRPDHHHRAADRAADRRRRRVRLRHPQRAATGRAWSRRRWPRP